MRILLILGLASFSSMLVASGSVHADEATRVHLGLESSIYSNTSITGDTTVPGTGGVSTSVKVDRNVSEVGLPGSAAFSLGALLGDQFDLGTRLSYSSQKTDAGSNSGSVELSGYSVSPYVAYVTGSHGDAARFALGITGGIGNSKVTTTTVSTTTSSASASSTTSESSADAKSYGAFVRLHGFVGEAASIDPAFSISAVHATANNVDLSGLSLMFTVGFSIWPGTSAPVEEKPRPRHHPAVASADPSEGEPAAMPAQVAAKPKAGKAVLKFGNERTITLLKDTKSNEQDVIVLVRDPAREEELSTCTALTIHAVNQQDESVATTWGTATSQSMRFQVLKATVSLEILKKVVTAPIASNAAVPEHWIDVCSQRWKISEQERAHLKEFVADFPQSSTEPTTAEPTSSDTP